MERSGNGKWAISSIVLLLTTVACVIALAVVSVNLTNANKEKDEALAEVSRYREITGSTSSDSLSSNLVAYNINFENLYSAIESTLAPKAKSFANIEDINTSTDGKYVAVHVMNYAGEYVRNSSYSISTNVPFGLYLYKKINESEWKKSAFSTSANVKCSDLSEEEMRVFKGMKFNSDQTELTCEKDGGLIPLSSY